MNKVININFQGRILPIEEQAYEILKQYIASLVAYFANEEGRDEIINDIECRIAELCDERLKKGEVCINEASIHLIISSIGRPADFEAQDGFEQNDPANHTTTDSKDANQHETHTTGTPKRLYRDEQNKILGGVCSGIANYFGLEPLLVRILWIFLVGLNVLGYLILWVAVPSSSDKEVGGVRKRLFRDIDHKIIGGVCAGLSKYFGLRVGIVRLLFLIPFIRFIFNFRHFHLFQFWDSPDFPNFLDITFSPGAVFVYIVLWLVLPEAKTSADKLEMVGEKVDLNSIKNTIQNDMEGFSKRAQSWGSEFYKKNKPNPGNENTEATASQQNEHASNSTSSNPPYSNEPAKGFLYFIGKFITIVVKVFVYFILAIMGVGVLAALFALGIAGTSVLPLKGFILEEGIQSYAFYGIILFFLWVPVIAIVTSIIRRIAGYKKPNKWVRISFVSLWSFGWVCFFYFLSSLGNSFSKHNIPYEQNIQINNPNVAFLEVSAAQMFKYYDDDSFDLSPFDRYNNEDSIFVRNLRVRIVQSKTDSFQVHFVKLSNGKSVQEANQNAEKINFTVSQEDSLLYLDKGIAITKNNKFRNQHIIMTIAVPVGKRIKISNQNWRQVNVKINYNGIRTRSLKGTQDFGWFDEWNEPWDGASYSYEKGAEYIMTANGLALLKPAKDAPLKEENQIKSDEDNPLNDLKQERRELEENKEKESPKVSISNNGAKQIWIQKTSQLLDFHWVLDRFTY